MPLLDRLTRLKETGGDNCLPAWIALNSSLKPDHLIIEGLQQWEVQKDDSVKYWYKVTNSDGTTREEVWVASYSHGINDTNPIEWHQVISVVESESESEQENMSLNITQLKKYIHANLNVMIVGPAGTGKTTMLRLACEELGLTLKYYNAATLDPFADLIGLPVPDKETKTVEYFRPHDVDNAEVVFCDELNRASTQTTNAIFEMVQFRTINGEPLPKLRCVVTAINPVEDGYDTDELDVALVDRFDIYLNAPPEANVRYFEEKFGKDYARVGIQLFNEYQKDYNSTRRSRDNTLGYFSPRRLDKLLETFMKWSTPQTIVDVLPKDVLMNPKDVSDRFNIALGNMKAPPPPPKPKYDPKDPGLKKLVSKQLGMKAEDVRKKNNVADFKKAYDFAKRVDPKSQAKLLEKLALALNYQVGIGTIDTVWREYVKDFSPLQEQKMMNLWINSKVADYFNIKLTW